MTWPQWKPHARRSITAATLVMVAATSGGCTAIAARKFLPRENSLPSRFDVKSERLSMTTSDGVALTNRLGTNVLGRFWASRGYTVVFQGTRGRYRSGGTYYPLGPERQDGMETLTWLRRQPWFNGRLGMWGGSTFGYTQWVLGDQVDPQSTAFLIQICSTSFHDMFYPGGAFSLESALFWAVRSRGAEDVWPSPASLRRGVEGFPLIEADNRAAGDIPFFNDWVNHPADDGYSTPPLEGDLEITGPISLIIHVATTAPNTDFTGKLVDVHPDGKAYNVSDGIVRRRFEDQREASIQIELWPTSMVFRRGHRLRLEVSSSNFPRFDRNPNTGRPIATETQPVSAVQTVFHGPTTPSRLVLPVIPR